MIGLTTLCNPSPWRWTPSTWTMWLATIAYHACGNDIYKGENNKNCVIFSKISYFSHTFGKVYVTFASMNRRDIYNKYNGHCAYCGKKIEFDDMTIDWSYCTAIEGAYRQIDGWWVTCIYQKFLQIECDNFWVKEGTLIALNMKKWQICCEFYGKNDKICRKTME